MRLVFFNSRFRRFGLHAEKIICDFEYIIHTKILRQLYAITAKDARKPKLEYIIVPYALHKMIRMFVPGIDYTQERNHSFVKNSPAKSKTLIIMCRFVFCLYKIVHFT